MATISGRSDHPLRCIQRLVELLDAGSPCALAVVLESAGSTPRGVGAAAVIEGDGRIYGTVGGGQVEATTQRRAAEVARSGKAAQFDFTMLGGALSDTEPVCGGQMRLLLVPGRAQDRPALASAVAAWRARTRGVLRFEWHGACSPDVFLEYIPENGIAPVGATPPPRWAGEARRALEREEAQYVPASTPAAESDKTSDALVVPLIPPPRLWVFGGGHVGQAVAWQASLVGFDITVFDDRPEFTNPDLFPSDVATCCGPMAETLERCHCDPGAAIVIVTRGHQRDAEVLEQCLRRPAAYIGMIGSRRKVALMRAAFLESGKATKEELDRVHAPIGLDIGAVTVPEIAASIVAQLIAVRRRVHPGGSAAQPC